MIEGDLAAHVRALVDAAPPLSDARRERIQALLRTTPDLASGEHDPRAGRPQRATPGRAPGRGSGTGRPAQTADRADERTPRVPQQEPSTTPA